MDESTRTVDSDGTITYRNSAGLLHRIDGPAVECVNGTKCWCINGQLHRVDGPAIEDANGDKEWYLNGQYHRIDGPAIEYANGAVEYWYKDKQIIKETYLSKEFQIKIILEG